MDDIISKIKSEAIYHTVYITEFNKAILNKILENNAHKVPETQPDTSTDIKINKNVKTHNAKNTGHHNSGHHNSVHHNSVHHNSGHHNNIINPYYD